MEMLTRIVYKRALISAAILGLAIILGIISTHFNISSQAQPAYSSENLIRLHILANSDRPVDQDLKLKVRDAILEAAHEVFSGALSRDQAEIYIQQEWDH